MLVVIFELEVLECDVGLNLEDVFELLVDFELLLCDGGLDEDFEENAALLELLLEAVCGLVEVVESEQVVDVV